MNPIGVISTGASRVTSLIAQNPLITALVTSAASSFFSYGVGIAIATAAVGHATSSYFELANDLTRWCEQATNEERPNRIEAAKRIKHCYTLNSYELNLGFLNLTNLPDSIRNLSSLQKLDLSVNQLTTLPVCIKNLKSLQILFLRCNLLTAIPDCMKNLTSLKELDLCNNEITTLPDSIGNLRSLQTLDLSENLLTTLPVCIKNLNSLQVLELRDNQLATIPDSIGNLTSLQKLGLSRNQLTAIPDLIKTLSSLQDLNLSENQLYTIPNSIRNLTSLQTLELNDNRLTVIPDCIGSLSSLRGINLSFNRLTAIPNCIGNLSSLLEISLSSNRLTAIPDSVGNLRSLQGFYLHMNQLTTIPPILANLSNQCHLTVEHNLLSPVAIQTFQDAIAQTRQLHPLLGPNLVFTIYDTPSLQVESLEENLHFWLKKFQIIFPKNSNEALWIDRDATRYPTTGSPLESLSFYNPLLELDDHEKTNLTQFLQRVQKTKDFASPRTQGNVVLRVDRMLEGACKNPEFLRMMNWIIEGALSTCNDRVAEAFDQIEIQWKILCNSQNLTDQKLADLVIGLDRVDRLNQIANAKIAEKQLGDAIEVVLFFRTKLAQALNLPISTESMLYPSMSGITTEELEEARKKIIADTGSRNSNIEILCNSTLWSDRIREKESEFFEKLIDDLNESSELNPDVLQIETNAQIKEATRRFTRSILYSN